MRRLQNSIGFSRGLLKWTGADSNCDAGNIQVIGRKAHPTARLNGRVGCQNEAVRESPCLPKRLGFPSVQAVPVESQHRPRPAGRQVNGSPYQQVLHGPQGPSAESIRKHAAELAALAPDVILANGSVVVAPLLQATRTVPVVFVILPDPVGGGFVDSLARPGGNVTGFLQFEYGLAGKWLELLKQMVPGVTRAAIMRDPTTPSGTGQFGATEQPRNLEGNSAISEFSVVGHLIVAAVPQTASPPQQ